MKKIIMVILLAWLSSISKAGWKEADTAFIECHKRCPDFQLNWEQHRKCSDNCDVKYKKEKDARSRAHEEMVRRYGDDWWKQKIKKQYEERDNLAKAYYDGSTQRVANPTNAITPPSTKREQLVSTPDSSSCSATRCWGKFSWEASCRKKLKTLPEWRESCEHARRLLESTGNDSSRSYKTCMKRALDMLQPECGCAENCGRAVCTKFPEDGSDDCHEAHWRD